MLEILYTSVATKPFSEEELMALLAECRVANDARDVTGILVYQAPDFMQLLEGEEAVLRPLLEVIREDPRHRSVNVCSESPIAERGFAGWSMAFQDLAKVDPARLEGFSSFLEDGFTTELVRREPSAARELLEVLRTLDLDI